MSLVGVVPERTETGTGMSDTLMAALPAALALVLGELARIDIHAWPRARRQQPDIWWERNARSRGATHA